MSNAEILDALEELARMPQAFVYPIEYLKRKR